MRISLAIALMSVLLFVEVKGQISSRWYPVVANHLASKLKYRNPGTTLRLVNNVILKTAGNLDGEYERCRAYITGSLCYTNIQKYDSSSAFLDSAALLTHRISDPNQKGEFYHAKGMLYSEIGENEQALNCFFQAVTLCTKPYAMGMVYNDIGREYRILGNDTAAQSYFQRSYEIGIRYGDSLRVASTMNNFAGIYRSRKEYDKALLCYERALTIRQFNKDTSGIISITINQAIVYDKIGKTSLSIRLMNEILPLAITRRQKSDEVTIKCNLGFYYLNEGKLDKAEEILENAFIEAKDNKLFELGKKAGLILSELYARQGQYAKALENFKYYTDFQNSSNKEKLLQNTQLLDARFRMRENKQKIEKLQAERETATLKTTLQQNKISRQRTVLLLLVLILLLTFSLLLVIFKRKQVQQRLNARLGDLVRQKEFLMREIHHRVKNNLQLVASLLHFQASKNEGADTDVLRKSEDRIHTIALLHEKLYHSESLNNISLRDYLEQIAIHLSTSFSSDRLHLDLVCEVEDIGCDIDQLVPCGLIINELVTNSIKHAFAGESGGTIAIKASSTHGQLKLEVADNGCGISVNDEKNFRLGMRLVKGLVKQLKGSLQMLQNAGQGVSVIIDFPLKTSMD
jgi:two-component system, sensor histidine kinase PdtaS